VRISHGFVGEVLYIQEELEQHGQKLIVSVDPPHSILATETGLDETLFHRSDDLRLQTAQVFEEPCTDISMFHLCIQCVATGTTSKYQMIMYIIVTKR
jgi:hypothetical protein